MEFIDGMSLRDLIKRQGALAPARAVPLFKQALSALDYAHNFNYVDESGVRRKGVIHRDIKPANMLLGATARLKIADFGIVKLAGERGLTWTGFNPGTVEYMSPEQIRGLVVDARSDIYSLGVAFYEALTGRLPFPRSDTGSEYEIFRGHIELAPPPLATLRPDVPEALSALVMRSLEKDPDARFQSAAEFLEGLLDYDRSGLPSRAETAGASSNPPPPTRSITEDISYDDTGQAPITSTVVRPKLIGPPIASQAIESAPASLRAAQPSGERTRRYGLLVAGALIALLIVVGAMLVFLKQNDTSSTAATGDPTPVPVVPTPTVAQEDARLKQAREAEAEERYKDAIMLYGYYVQEHSLNDADPGVKEIKARWEKPLKFYEQFYEGESQMIKKDYAAAERGYAEALKLIPDSKIAQAGLERARSHLSKGARD